MQPGNYLAKCETVWIESVGKEHRAVFQWRVVDGKFDGVALPQWVMVSNGGGIVSPTGRYARYCALALGRPLNTDDPIGEPNQIFSGGVFQVFVGFRKTERGRGGKFADQLALTRKDDADYLRVHDILSRELW